MTANRKTLIASCAALWLGAASSAHAQGADTGTGADQNLDVTMTLLPEGATRPDAVTREIELPAALLERNARAAAVDAAGDARSGDSAQVAQPSRTEAGNARNAGRRELAAGSDPQNARERGDGTAATRDERQGAAEVPEGREGGTEAREGREGAAEAREGREGAGEAREGREGAAEARERPEGAAEAREERERREGAAEGRDRPGEGRDAAEDARSRSREVGRRLAERAEEARDARGGEPSNRDPEGGDRPARSDGSEGVDRPDRPDRPDREPPEGRGSPAGD